MDSIFVTLSHLNKINKNLTYSKLKISAGEEIDFISVDAQFDVKKNGFIWPLHFQEKIKPARLTLGYSMREFPKYAIFSKFIKSSFYS